MPKVSEAYLEARRQQILEAAFTCFARKGFHETTMQDISREAGVSYGVVYHYFRSKEDVIEASWRANQQARATRIQMAQRRGSTPEVLSELLAIYMRRLEQPESSPEMRLRIQLFGETLLNPRIAANIRRTWNDVLKNVEDIIHRGQERGEINAEMDPHALARVYLALHDGVLLQKTVDPSLDLWKLVQVFKALHNGQLWEGQRKGVDGNEGQELPPASERGVSQGKRPRRRQGRQPRRTGEGGLPRTRRVRPDNRGL